MSAHSALPTRRGRLALVAGAVFVAGFGLALAGCGDDDSPTNPTPSGPTATVHIVLNAMSKGTLAYSPNPDTVAVGTTVIWKNDDTITHTVTSNTAGQFNMTIGSGSTGSHKFDTAGSFPYHCTIGGHTMSGTLVAQ